MRDYLRHPLVHKLLRQTLSYGGATWISAALGLLHLSLLAHYFPLDLFGMLALFISFGTVGQILFGIQSWQGFIIRASRLEATGQGNQMPHLIRLIHQIDRSFALILASLLALAIFVTTQFGLWPDSLPQQQSGYHAMIIGLYYPILQLGHMPAGYFRHYQEFRLLALHRIIIAILLCIGVVIGILCQMDLLAAAIIITALRMLDPLSLLYLAWRNMKRRFPNDTGILRTGFMLPSFADHPDMPSLLKASYGQNTGLALIEWIDMIIGMLLLTAAELGLLRIAKMLSGIIIAFSNPFRQIIYPHIARVISQGDAVGFGAILRSSLLLLFAITTCVALGYLLLGDWILLLLGGREAMAAYWPAFAYLMGALGIMMVSPLVPIFFTCHLERWQQIILWSNLAIILPTMWFGTRWAAPQEMGVLAIAVCFLAFAIIYAISSGLFLWVRRKGLLASGTQKEVIKQ